MPTEINTMPSVSTNTPRKIIAQTLVPFSRACKQLGISRLQLQILLTKGDISPLIITGRRRLFSQAQLERVREIINEA